MPLTCQRHFSNTNRTNDHLINVIGINLNQLYEDKTYQRT